MKTLNNSFGKLSGSIFAGMLILFVVASCNQPAGSQADSQNQISAPESGVLVSQTVKGEILDLSCYMSDGSKGKAHMSCAQGCLDGGLPAGILSEDGSVYLLIENHQNSEAYAKAIENAAQIVEINGTIINKDGMRSLLVENVKVEG